MEKQTIAQRIVMLLDILGMEVTPFAESLEINPGNIRNYMHKGNRPGSDLLEKIANTYPQVNLVWLLTGKEEPLAPIRGPLDISTDTVHTSLYSCQHELNMARNEIGSLREQLKTMDELVATKNDTIDLLKSIANQIN